jgi:hypothetical protein
MRWESMTYKEYAEFETATSSEKIMECDGLYWKPSRKIFYRPLNPFHRLTPEEAKSFNPVFGMKQYATAQSDTNSCLNLIVFKNTDQYNPKNLIGCQRN